MARTVNPCRWYARSARLPNLFLSLDAPITATIFDMDAIVLFPFAFALPFTFHLFPFSFYLPYNRPYGVSRRRARGPNGRGGVRTRRGDFEGPRPVLRL